MGLLRFVGFREEFGRGRGRGRGKRRGRGKEESEMGTGKGPPSALLRPFLPSPELLASSVSPSRLAVVRERLARATSTSSDGMAPARESRLIDSDGDNDGTTPATTTATMMER
ncbi:hypothetical protein TIFTF001_052174 [Ficus carica]|uniref:Uncharacterized protein n=1 Tax=Ficus carica TaxID=3494 RepID=A0AA88EEM1_FICCA|nr:hypothetical protein TIFTF001_052174 [Ficus carica]